MDDISISILRTIHKSVSNGIRSAKATKPRKWLADRKLSIDLTGVCFQSGQGHHRKQQSFKDSLERVGFLRKSEAATSTGEQGYSSFAPFSILFPLKNGKGDVVNFYAIDIRNNKTQWLNEEGIYPEYPKPTTRKLIIVANPMEAATILQAGILDNREAVMALNEGVFTQEHQTTIEQLTDLQEIILIEREIETQTH
jgi:hypothetical protein